MNDNFKGGGPGLTEVLSLHFHAVTEENYKTSNQDSLGLGRDSNPAPLDRYRYANLTDITVCILMSLEWPAEANSELKNVIRISICCKLLDAKRQKGEAIPVTGRGDP
jgi:hypothetical protein